MAKKLNYDSKTLLNIKFSPAEKGYDALEVDQVFDKIIEDYNAFVTSFNELAEQNKLQSEKLSELKEQHEKTLFELAAVKKQLETLKKTSGVTDDNYRLMTKVSAYERVLHRKGVDLKKALSDPDNC